MAPVQGVLLDLDGVLAIAWRPVPGAPRAVAWLRERRIPFLVLTNATSDTRAGVAERLRFAGFDLRPDEILTAAVAAAWYLRAHHPGARCFLLGATPARRELHGLTLVEEGADVVLVAGPDDTFTWENLNRAFGMLLDGATLVAMHRNLAWMTEDGMKLDAGAFVSALEQAAGVQAAVAGKPSPAFFQLALQALAVPAEEVAMVGDDIRADVLAAQSLGLTGVLVRTGKFRLQDLELPEGRPDHVMDSVADLPGLVERLRG